MASKLRLHLEEGRTLFAVPRNNNTSGEPPWAFYIATGAHMSHNISQVADGVPYFRVESVNKSQSLSQETMTRLQSQLATLLRNEQVRVVHRPDMTLVT